MSGQDVVELSQVLMNIEQVFVSTVAILLGVLGVLVAAVNPDWCFRLPKAQWAEKRWGRSGARWAFLLIGLVLILVGLYLAALEFTLLACPAVEFTLLACPALEFTLQRVRRFSGGPSHSV